MVSRRNGREIRRQSSPEGGGGGLYIIDCHINCQLTANEGKGSYEYYRAL